MSSTPLSSVDAVAPAPAYRPELIWTARRSFFNEGQAPIGMVQDAVLRSWRRCSEGGRHFDEPVEFQPVDRPSVAQLLAMHADLLAVAQPELNDLAVSVADAGYAVLLTDCRGNALAVDGAIAQRSAPLRQAFRTGVDLSEAAIGTNAMAVALREAKPVRVLGAEHFLTETQIFHCSAAPVFDPQGEVIGAVDVSRDMPGMVDSTLWLAARCARRIERRLFRELPAMIHVEIDAGSGAASQPYGSGAWLAFGASGELLAANRSARALLGLPGGSTSQDFGHLFGERFGTWVSDLRRNPQGVSMRLKDGVRLRAVSLDEPVRSTISRNAAPRCISPSAAQPEFGDARVQRAYERTQRIVAAGLPVLITGETGTGKEVTARALHDSGNRRHGPFAALNCAAVPEELLAGELFGHVEGAFTGARRGGAAGKIEAAHGGTLFLDEIGDMPLSLQAALLRVLDSGEVLRLGCSTARSIDFSIVCATHRSLPALVDEGLFREDLMYRVSGHTLSLLPLRERQDFDAILDTLLRRFGALPEQASGALRATLRTYPWKGNVRELSHAVQRALALAEQGQQLSEEEFALDANVQRQTEPPSSGLMQQATEHAIREALRCSRGSVTGAAKLLGIGRATLYRRLKSGAL